MHDPVSVGRRVAYRAIAIQAVVVGLVATAFVMQGQRQALAAAIGGLALVAGHWVAASLALGGGVQSAGVAVTRMFLGVLGKWSVVVAVLAIALGVWRLPPLPMLTGLIAGLLAYFVALNCAASNFENGNKRER